MTKGPWVFSLLSPLHPAATPQCSQTPKCLQHTHSHLHLTSLTYSRNLLLEAPPLTLWSYSCRSPPNCHITSECVLTLLSFSGFHDTSLTQLTSHCQLFSPLLPMLSAVFAQSSQMVAVSISWAFSLLRNSSNYHSHCMTSRFSAQTLSSHQTMLFCMAVLQHLNQCKHKYHISSFHSPSETASNLQFALMPCSQVTSSLATQPKSRT